MAEEKTITLPADKAFRALFHAIVYCDIATDYDAEGAAERESHKRLFDELFRSVMAQRRG